MIAAVVDTNAFVQATIWRAASYRVVLAGFDERFRFIVSHDTLDELRGVLRLPSIRARNSWTSAEIDDYLALIVTRADIFELQGGPAPSLPRDATDVKLLALAQSAEADFLVTNDRRHLLRLGRHGRTEIVTPAAFLRRL